MSKIEYSAQDESFRLENAEDTSYLYFPLACEKGLKSSITPSLGGDSKLSQAEFLMEPVSSENLHNNRSTRNFWCLVEGARPWSATGASAEAENARYTDEEEENAVEAGFLWHKVTRKQKRGPLSSEIISFVPYDANTEIMRVVITNQGDVPVEMSAIAAIPIYGRSADNIRDHRNVTSMLHRIRTSDQGILVAPTMTFDERGHKLGRTRYYVAGCEGGGELPMGFYPTVLDYIGEGGSFTHPAAVFQKDGQTRMSGAGVLAAGEEAMGAICFDRQTLAPGASRTFLIFMGISEDLRAMDKICEKYGNDSLVLAALEETRNYWQAKANIDFHTGDTVYDHFLKWVSFQPFLRRIFGCSFLPHHDYGKGGRGWRDLWQDCLSLLVMDPSDVRADLVNNIAGVRMDGTNATIIGSAPGQFIADRNGIARVWMDHGVWPFKTILLYIHQTGDTSILYEKAPYFKDAQILRGTELDREAPAEGWTRTADGSVYEGTMLEHILLEHINAFFDIGEHGLLRLRGADWNDALDMAPERGESVAFSCAYAGNLRDLAALLREAIRLDKISRSADLAAELSDLLEWTGHLPADASSEIIDEGVRICREYQTQVARTVSGQTRSFDLERVATALENMADYLTDKIRSQEWIQEDKNSGWFNSYYDNSGHKVERAGEDLRMMLTGQVFSIMGKVADDEQVRQITHAADAHLYREGVGGYCLNTNFNEVKMDMGRMFGFAYGQKENGAVFSHMSVMYGSALYERGFVREGYKSLRALADCACDFDTSRIYPGIPEYFAPNGRGMYHYLTGAGSWYLIVMVMNAFGVRGEMGDLVVMPQLVKEQFDQKGDAGIRLTFDGVKLNIILHNPSHLDAGHYHIALADWNGQALAPAAPGRIVIPRAELEKAGPEQTLELVLG